MKHTSRAAHESIKPAKAYYHQKVIEGLEKLKVGGTFAEIAEAALVAPERIWKRLSELAKDGQIYDTGLTRKLPSGRHGTVWQLTNQPVIQNAPTPGKETKPLTQLSLL